LRTFRFFSFFFHEQIQICPLIAAHPKLAQAGFDWSPFTSVIPTVRDYLSPANSTPLASLLSAGRQFLLFFFVLDKRFSSGQRVSQNNSTSFGFPGMALFGLGKSFFFPPLKILFSFALIAVQVSSPLLECGTTDPFF